MERLSTSTSGTVGETITEASTGQPVSLLRTKGPRVSLRLRFDEEARAPYPDEVFVANPSRFTRFADALAEEALDAAGDLTGLARARAIACATAERFTYGHPEVPVGYGYDAVQPLGCGMTEGSCVDINTYFIAALRAAGIEAGYITGYFFPEEKGGTCTDGHCWVVTRIDGETQEWDIAHHLKLGTRDIAPGLNPKPGFRAATFHSMGLGFPSLGLSEIKALIEPVAVIGERVVPFSTPKIRLHRTVPAAA